MTPSGSDPEDPAPSAAAPRPSRDAERRYARKMRALERWEAELDTPGRRLRAWASMVFADHGFLRMIYLNLHEVAPGAFRAAQPTPGQIRRLADRGLRSVVTLRGGVLFGSYALEREACAARGLDFRRVVLRSRALPTREELAGLRELIETVETPVLFHCKSGADRAGFMAALWLILREGRSVEEARGQLSLRYGHVPFGPTGVLDRFFARAAEAEARGVPFADWAARDYDREALTAEHRAAARGTRGRLAAWITDRLLRRE